MYLRNSPMFQRRILPPSSGQTLSEKAAGNRWHASNSAACLFLVSCSVHFSVLKMDALSEQCGVKMQNNFLKNLYRLFLF
jgi:hypothetical protein